MTMSSVRKRVSPASEPAASYPVIDVVEVKVSHGAPAPGFILVPTDFRPASPESLVGESVVIEPPGPRGNGYGILAAIVGVRDHGTTTSILVENWPEGFPSPRIGWNLRMPDVEGITP